MADHCCSLCISLMTPAVSTFSCAYSPGVYVLGELSAQAFAHFFNDFFLIVAF